MLLAYLTSLARIIPLSFNKFPHSGGGGRTNTYKLFLYVGATYNTASGKESKKLDWVTFSPAARDKRGVAINVEDVTSEDRKKVEDKLIKLLKNYNFKYDFNVNKIREIIIGGSGNLDTFVIPKEVLGL